MTKIYDLTEEEKETLIYFAEWFFEEILDIEDLMKTPEWQANKEEYIEETKEFIEERRQEIEPILIRVGDWSKSNG